MLVWGLWGWSGPNWPARLDSGKFSFVMVLGSPVSPLFRVKLGLLFGVCDSMS